MDQWVDTFLDPIGHFGALWRPFWMLQEVWRCRRWGSAPIAARLVLSIKEIFSKKFWIFIRRTKIVITRPIFKIFTHFFLHGVSLCGFHICFWCQSNPTWNDRNMGRICSAGIFALPRNRQLRGPHGIGLRAKILCSAIFHCTKYSY